MDAPEMSTHPLIGTPQAVPRVSRMQYTKKVDRLLVQAYCDFLNFTLHVHLIVISIIYWSGQWQITYVLLYTCGHPFLYAVFIGLSISMAVDPFESWVAVGTSLGYHVIWDMRFQLPIQKWQHTGHGGKCMYAMIEHSRCFVFWCGGTTPNVAGIGSKMRVSVCVCECVGCGTWIWLCPLPHPLIVVIH